MSVGYPHATLGDTFIAKRGCVAVAVCVSVVFKLLNMDVGCFL